MVLSRTFYGIAWYCEKTFNLVWTRVPCVWDNTESDTQIMCMHAWQKPLICLMSTRNFTEWEKMKENAVLYTQLSYLIDELFWRNPTLYSVLIV